MPAIEKIAHGDCLLDTLVGRIGVVEAVGHGAVRLRPVAYDGPAWSTPVSAVRRARAEEVRAAEHQGRDRR